jgi:hypothetical protein
MERKHEHIVDANGDDITIGTRVECSGYIGSVIEITDVDGDVDDDGRSIVTLPTVVVTFDDTGDGVEVDNFSTYWLGRHYDDDAPFEAGDLTIHKGE